MSSIVAAQRQFYEQLDNDFDEYSKTSMHIVPLRYEGSLPGARWYSIYPNTTGGKHLITNEKPAVIARCTKCYGLLAIDDNGTLTPLPGNPEFFLHRDAADHCEAMETPPPGDHEPEQPEDKGPEQPTEPPPTCRQGHTVRWLTSKTVKNPNRDFYKCTICDEFRWRDAVPNLGPCYVCGGAGHWAVACPQRSIERTPAAASRVAVPPPPPPPPPQFGSDTGPSKIELTEAQRARIALNKTAALQRRVETAATEAVALSHAHVRASAEEAPVAEESEPMAD